MLRRGRGMTADSGKFKVDVGEGYDCRQCQI
jgi:hypothetical protein